MSWLYTVRAGDDLGIEVTSSGDLNRLSLYDKEKEFIAANKGIMVSILNYIYLFLHQYNWNYFKKYLHNETYYCIHVQFLKCLYSNISYEFKIMYQFIV